MARMKRPGSKTMRRNYTMLEEDAENIRRLAKLITPPGWEPNESLAVRVAVREALENRKRADRTPE